MVRFSDFRACLIINVADRVVWLEMVFDVDEGVYFYVHD